MYDIWVAIVIGIVEGLTEFLPVSSTGHMILTEDILKLEQSDPMMNSFMIVIQFGAILAVVIIYWKRLLQLLGIGKFRSTQSDHKRFQQEGSLQPVATKQMNVLHILIGISPAMILAFFLSDWIDRYLFRAETVLIGLVLGAIHLIVAERTKEPYPAKSLDEITYQQAFIIGCWQILSLWPGFSRSGSTIAGGMMSGVSRAASADFTFIMAIPIMFAASGYSILKNFEHFSASDIYFFIVGFVVSFVVAFFAVFSFIRFVQKIKLTYFAYYRLLLAVAFALYLWL